MSASSQKARHYAALGGHLRKLNATMAETDALMGALGEHLQCTREFAASHAAQFMATSCLLDAEIEDTRRRIDADADAEGTDTEGQGQRQAQAQASP